MKAFFHLPGLFEFHELYKLFLPLCKEHREYFYDHIEISSIYGAPMGTIFSGGRLATGNSDPFEVLALLKEYGISARLTFSNSQLKPEHLKDEYCNFLCSLFEDENNGIIIHSDLLSDYIKENYSKFYQVSSTTKVLLRKEELIDELANDKYAYVVPDFRHNKKILDYELNEKSKAKVELLVNECCDIGCNKRKECYENVSRLALNEDVEEFRCTSPLGSKGYSFSLAMKNPAFISNEAIIDEYLPSGINNFKIEGRGLGSALVLEILLYYLVKPQYQINVREAIYLDNMLDLF
ncbi:MAG: hypothetical protein PUD22_09600 [Erysipelotrichaceae bacterium]|nr:hypothetical protein [Erysipelotrichaceae bacterium]